MRGYGLTPWGRALAAVVEAGADHRHLSGARRYFRDRHVEQLSIADGEITALVRGSQLDPFGVTLVPRPVDPATVVQLLRRSGKVEALLALARGEQPAALGELLAPTESADLASGCSCPDEAPRCIHVMAVVFELSAQIDKQPLTLLRVLGTDLPELLDLARDRAEAPPSDPDDHTPAPAPQPVTDFYGDGAPLPPVPEFPRIDALAELDPGGLRSALRASGVGATELAEALDDLAELYAVFREHR
nr:hypothetical protein [Gordonia hirsuta]